MDKTFSLFRHECHFCICCFRIGGEESTPSETNRQRWKGVVPMELLISESLCNLARAESCFPHVRTNPRLPFFSGSSHHVSAKNLCQSIGHRAPEIRNFT